jgi:hypothetical protein
MNGGKENADRFVEHVVWGNDCSEGKTERAVLEK